MNLEDEPLISAVLKAFSGTTIRTIREGQMIDATASEKQALEGASDLAGEYLTWLQKSDLATLTKAEWMQLLECVVTGFQESLAKLVAARRAEDAPF